MSVVLIYIPLPRCYMGRQTQRRDHPFPLNTASQWAATKGSCCSSSCGASLSTNQMRVGMPRCTVGNHRRESSVCEIGRVRGVSSRHRVERGGCERTIGWVTWLTQRKSNSWQTKQCRLTLYFTRYCSVGGVGRRPKVGGWLETLLVTSQQSSLFRILILAFYKL